MAPCRRAHPHIRLATDQDVERLVTIEVEAGQLFRSVGMPEVAEHAPDREALRTAVAAERVWVAEVDRDVGGYVQGEVLDGNAHVAQVSVAPTHARRGLGRRLVEVVECWGRSAGRPATTLTTFRDVPWNEPYYARLGYRLIPTERIGPELARVMDHEATLPGIDPARRCAMVTSL